MKKKDKKKGKDKEDKKGKKDKKKGKYFNKDGARLGIWCLTPLSTM